MSWKRCMGLALVAVVALAGCKKKDESQQQPPAPQAAAPAAAQPGESGGAAAQPAASGTPTAAGRSAATVAAVAPAASSEEVLKALDSSVDSLAGGLGGAFGGLAMARKASATPGMGEPAAAGDEADEVPPIRRVQMHMDLAGFRASPLGGIAQALLGALRESGDIEASEVCLFDLLDKVNSAFFDVTLGPDGEPAGIVLSVKSTATKDEVLTCMRGSLDEGEQIKEIPLAGGTGYTVEPSDDPVPVALFEKAPGHWLVGMRPSIEAAAGAADPETDSTFATLSGPLGAGVIRLTIVPTADFAQLASKVEADAPPPVQCLRNVISRFKGGSAGVRLAPDFALSLALQNGSATEAAETQACLSGIWQILKPVILSEAGEEEAAQMQAMFGMSLVQLLDTVQIRADGEFVKVTVSLPGDLLGKIAQIAAAMAQ